MIMTLYLSEFYLSFIYLFNFLIYFTYLADIYQKFIKHLSGYISENVLYIMIYKSESFKFQF